MPLPRCSVECRAVADPELRFSPSGVAVANLRLVAQDRRFNKQTNEWEDGDILWFRGTAFKQLAENISESVSKGELLLVTGKWKTDEWEDQEGNKKSATGFILDDVAKSLKGGAITASAQKAERSQPQSKPSDSDPWASPSSDEPPF